MALRCLLFSADEKTAHAIGQVLSDLGMEAEYCRLAVEAVKRVTGEVFQIMIVDWDSQPEAGFLIKTARERKASERPLNLAIVSNDASVPQALQAGANSVLRKPILTNQVKDTLTTARDLLRSRQESSSPATLAAAAAAGSAAKLPSSASEESHLRAGEFLQSTGPVPGAQILTETEAQRALEQGVSSEVDPLSGLTSMAEAVESVEAPPAPPTPSLDEPRGLSWHLRSRASTPPPEPAATEAKLPSHDETSSYTEARHIADESAGSSASTDAGEPQSEHEKRTEAALFAYITGESSEETESVFAKVFAKVRPWLGKIALVGALVGVGAFAYLKVPQDMWGKNLHLVTSYVGHQVHAWLNPQPVTTPQAPATHEDFGRAGDEYKLPVAENIPDATTDPSQIRVLPVIDPTAKQPNGAAANAGQTPAADTTTGPATGDSSQPAPVQGQDSQPAQVAPATIPAAADPTASPAPNVPAANVPQEQVHTDAPATSPVTPPTPAPTAAPSAPKNLPASSTSTPPIPSSLKSQMASMTPDASGNKPPEAALPAIEPVSLPEATVRGLLVQQADPVYPDTAKGQQGTVVLAVLIGRDGTVQDAKFLQGSLAFARSAIDAVKQWKFKPYTMNGRAVSVQTLLTLSFKPGS